MRLLIAFLVLCSIDVFGQYRMEWDTTYRQSDPVISVDTTFGAIVCLAENVVTAIGGFRIDTISLEIGEIPCPDGMFGCMVLHYGYVEKTKSSTYCTIYKGRYESNPKKWKILQVPEKYIIKFIE